ncbi:hypothetical protein TRFO_15083 [Tritrichomonas foetus]|uniref:Right handed beta helix domain-containing protein n=1 Tax=Tritrichomonas foetus TaxID=1144522 RepID=A0A1J4KUH3_9EUKA|nr:hypothetical protein TRFO_15083 [Tritrichomonas foetus]|eukprot:OHT14544.1 hypothetical protein TRFO_15083 [Tritrichomonas foetus]
MGNSNTIIEDCIFDNNKGDKEGGAVAILLSNGRQVRICNCQFLHNQGATQDFNSGEKNNKFGGAVYINGVGEVSIERCIFQKNQAFNGHAIYSLGEGQVWIKDECQFIDNSQNSESQIAIGGSNFDFSNSTISLSNGAQSFSRVISLLSGGSMNIHDATIRDIKSADSIGNAIFIEKGAVHGLVSNVSFIDVGTGKGSAIYCDGSSIDILDNKFIFNKGGDQVSSSIEINSTSSRKCTFNIFNNLFHRSKMAFIYTALEKGSYTPELIIESNTFEDCYAINPCCFEINTYHLFEFNFNKIIKQNPGNQYHLGAIYFHANLINQETFTLSNNYFGENLCNSDYGGGTGLFICNKDEPTNSYPLFTLRFEHCIFYKNGARFSYNDKRGRDNGKGGAFQIGFTESTSNINIEMDNCTFTDNHADKDGGALSIETIGTVKIMNCVFHDNGAGTASRGGSIYFEPDFDHPQGHHNESSCELIEISNTNFSNSDAFNAAAIYCKGGTKQTVLTITENCIFTDNGNKGCSILSEAKKLDMSDSTIQFVSQKARGLETKGETLLTNVKFINNTNNDGNGCALYVPPESEFVRINNCLFDGCGSGGNTSHAPVVIESAPVIFDGSNITFPDANKGIKALDIRAYGLITISNNRISNTNTRGALLYNPSDKFGNPKNENLTIEGNIFDNCLGPNARCFEIFLHSSNVIFSGNTIQNCVEGSNSYLGVIDGLGFLTSFTFDHCVFKNLVTSSDFGGASGLWIANNRQLLNINFESCVWENNQASVQNGDFRCRGHGGAFQCGMTQTVSNVVLRFSDCLFSSNYAEREGGALALHVQGNIIIERCKFNDNHAGQGTMTQVNRGGAIVIHPNYQYGNEIHNVADSINIINCSFNGNFALTDGNAIYIPYATTTDVSVLGSSFYRDSYNRQSSTIVVGAKSLLIDNITLSYEDNLTSRGIWENSTTFTLYNSEFTRCGHQEDGQALNIREATNSAIVDTCKFIDCGYNTNTLSVIVQVCKDFTFTQSEITFTRKKPEYIAAGIYCAYKCSFKLIDSNFTKCLCNTNKAGGAIVYKGMDRPGYTEDIVLDGCVFDNNSNPNALSACAIRITCTSVPELKDVTIKNHNDTSFIVAIFFSEHLRQEVILDHWVFENNCFTSEGRETDDCGGCGLWIAPEKTTAGYKDSWPLTFETCTWRNNHANKLGGAFAYGYSNTLRYIYLNFSKCIFENNICDGDKGGALSFNSQVEVKITKCTFRGNEAKGQHLGHALYVDRRCHVVISGSKFYDNGDTFSTSVVQHSGKQLDFIESEISFSTTEKGCRGIDMDYTGRMNLINSTFTRCNAGVGANSITTFHGGAIRYYKPSDSILDEEITIDGCIFDSNIAGNGCVMVLSTSTVPVLTRNIVKNQNTGRFILSVFFVAFQDVCVVENMEFKNCTCTQGDDSGGSGIWIANQEQISNGRPASLIFRNCTWENNRTPNKGGALHYGNSKTLVGMELTFDKCNFIGNQAQGTGGAVSLLTKSPIVFNECKFTNNHVTPKNANEKSRGSSIFVDSTTPLVSITGCVFNNETADDGNAIFVTSQVPACFVSGCYFQNCGVTGTVVVLECQEILFENNDILFDRVEKACRGLEIRTIAVTTISGSKFQKCRTIGSMAEADRHTWGAGIYLNNSLQSQEQEDFTMEECEFDACEGPNGCAICLNMSSAPVIRSTLCQNHRSGKYIFSIFCTTYFQDLFTIESCTFCNNQFQNSNKEDGGGSAIWISNDQYLLPGAPTKINFKNCNWTKNSGVYGGAFSYGKSDTVSNTELVFEKCHFENNQASGDMGGALFLFTIQPIYIDGCTFINNKVLNNIGKGSQALGGAITLDTSATTCTIIGTTFRKNGAQNGNALYVTEKTAYVELIDSHFLSNSNGNVGSQVLHNGKEIHATNTNFDYETITLHARGVEIINKSMSYFVKCDFTLCETDGWGGGLYINDDVNSKNEEQLTLDGCIFDSCSASNGSAVLCEIMCNPTISHCTVKNMKSGAYVFCFFFREFQEYVTVEECTFQDLKLNKQTTLDGGGSGIWIATDKKLYNGTSSKLTFNKCNFINNVAETNGGAISYGDSPTLKTTFLQLKECLFEGNTANGAQGGALWFTGDEPMLVSKCTFKNNKAVGANNLGGHIYVDSPSEQIQIYDSSFDSSNAQKGNAIYAEAKTKSLQIYGVTFDNCGTSNTVITSNAKDFQLSTSKIIFNESAPSKSARGIDLQIKSTTTITQTDFINCYSTQQGGAIYVDHGNGDSELNESMSITDCTFDGCYGTNGAAMFMRINDQPVLRGNVIKNSRGGNYIISIFYLKFIEYTLLDNCNFENNYLGPTSTADGGGSGIWIAPDKGVADNEIKYLTFSDCTFIGNSVAGSGGAFSYGGSATVKHTVLSFEACRFYHNSALGSGQEAGGGALYLRTTQPVFISKCLFDNNTATYGTGGALYIHTESNVTIENTQIARNQAAEKTSGIYINNEHQLTLFNSTIASNSAAGNNLAASLYLNNEGTAAIDQCKFDFTRQTSQYQITLTGTASSSTLSFNKCCFTHKGTSDETLTHILSTIAGLINVPAGNCFDTSESAGFQHGGGSVNKEKGIFNCNNCEDIYIPTAAPDPTPKATPERTIEPSDLTSLPTSIPTQIPSIEINETSDFNESSSTDNTVDDGNDNSKKVGMIAGIAIGSIVIIVVIIVLLWLFVLRGRSLQHKSDSENASEMNDETISGISGIDTTQDDPIWAGTTATQDNPLFNGGDDEQDEDDQMITNDFEESWGDSVI